MEEAKQHGHMHQDHWTGDGSRFDRMKDPERLRDWDPETIWSVLGKGAVETVVDVGAGIGVYAIHYAGKIPAGTVYACDIDPDAIKAMVMEIGQAGANNVVPVLAEEIHLPLPNDVADVVFAINVHHHLPDQQASMQEFHRLLRPGGTVGVIDWKKQETPKGPPHEIRLTPETIKGQLESAGFVEFQVQDPLRYAFFVTASKPG